MKSNDEAFEEVCRKFEAHHDAQALQELRDLFSRVDDPWDMAWLNYQEILFLVDMGNAPDARQRLEDLKRTLASRVDLKAPSDVGELNPHITLPMLHRHAEIRVAIAEGKEGEALKLIEDLEARYPKQLALPEFKALREDVATIRGFLLANAGRWDDARLCLENVTPLEERKGQHSYYLGRCYHESKQYERAKNKLIEALAAGLEPPTDGAAHYILGLVQYRLSDMEAAKAQFELSLKTADPAYLGTEIWGWLEATSRALGLQTEAENYRKLKRDSLPQA